MTDQATRQSSHEPQTDREVETNSATDRQSACERVYVREGRAGTG